MSASEILSELPNLSPEEIDSIYFQAAALRQHSIKASPELLAAIDEADASLERDGSFSIQEIQARIKSWPTK